MSEVAWPFLARSGVTYATRLWGLLLPGARVRGYPRRVLDLVPVAVFAALVAQGLPGAGPVDSAWRAVAAAVTITLAVRTRSLGVALLLGLATYLAGRAAGIA